MTALNTNIPATLIAALALWLAPLPALAYIGPGAGIGALGAVVGLIVAVVAALGVVLLWPLRAAMRRARAGSDHEGRRTAG
jgi:type VI protein secretion system component VasK